MTQCTAPASSFRSLTEQVCWTWKPARGRCSLHSSAFLDSLSANRLSQLFHVSARFLSLAIIFETATRLIINNRSSAYEAHNNHKSTQYERVGKINVGEIIRDLSEFSMQLINIFNVSQLAMHDFDRRNWQSIGFGVEKLFIDFAVCISSVSGLKAKWFRVKKIGKLKPNRIFERTALRTHYKSH